jgi:hypothetical protein
MENLQLSSSYATYYFATQVNKDFFLKKSHPIEPQYGGRRFPCNGNNGPDGENRINPRPFKLLMVN